MVAEAIPSTEVEQPNEAPEATPEVTTEAAPEVNQEEAELDSVFAAFADGAGTDATDGTPAATDGTPADPYAGLTPAQIAEKVRSEEADRAKSAAESVKSQAYMQGLANVAKNTPQAIEDKLDALGIVGEDKKFIRDAVHNLNSAYNQVYQDAIERANKTAGENFSTAYKEGAVKALGKDGADAAYDGNPDWETFFGRIGEQYAKKNGLATKKEVSEARTEAQKAALKKVDEALKSRGMSLAQFTGNANPSVPPVRGGGGRFPVGSQEWAENASVEELLADKARRAAAG